MCAKDPTKEFWDGFYKNKNTNIANCSSFCNYIYETYIKSHNNNKVSLKIGDFGCGNCRDSIFLANKGNYILSIDQSGVLEKPNENIELIVDDVENAITDHKLQSLLDIVYMRWFLHAVPYQKGTNIFKKSIQNLKTNGLLCIEVRSLNDTELIKNSTYSKDDNSYTTTHKRWLYTKENIEKMALENDLDIIELKEDYNFSKTDDTEKYISDPLLIRLVARKKVIGHYE